MARSIKHASRHGEEEELYGRVYPSRSAPDADEEVHGYEHQLPEDIEKNEVQGAQGAYHGGLEEEERDEILLHPSLYGLPRDEHAEHREEGREEDEEEADAVYAEGVAHAPFGEPLRLFHELHARCLLVEEKEEGQGDGKLDEGEDEGKALYEGLEPPVHEEEKDCPEEWDVYQGAQYGKGKLVHRDLQDNLYYQIAKDCYGAHYHPESIPLNIPGLDEPDETAQPLQDVRDAVHDAVYDDLVDHPLQEPSQPEKPPDKDGVVQLIHVILVIDRAEEPGNLFTNRSGSSVRLI